MKEKGDQNKDKEEEGRRECKIVKTEMGARGKTKGEQGGKEA